jgi:HPt (histidine-containing phosphotransfer) domain-containing protein
MDLLARLRARFPTTAALAHTADDSPTLHRQLRAAGFDEVLVKPLTALRLRQAVEILLSGQENTAYSAGTVLYAGALPLWDDAVALTALNGNHEHVATLRRMFLEELPRHLVEIQASLQTSDPQAASQVLHQLKASSGFVGAMRLQAATTALERTLADAARVSDFFQTAQETLGSCEPIDT